MDYFVDAPEVNFRSGNFALIGVNTLRWFEFEVGWHGGVADSCGRATWGSWRRNRGVSACYPSLERREELQHHAGTGGHHELCCGFE